MQPLAVAVVSFGHKSPVAWVVKDEVSKARRQFPATDSVMLFDLRQSMAGNSANKDMKAVFRADGTHSSSIVKVYSNDGFADVVEDGLQQMMQQAPSIVVVSSASGFHRADVFGRTVTDCANSITVDGQQMFTVNHFPLCDCKDAKSVRQQFKYAAEWASAPWAATEAPSDITKCYGHAAVLMRPDAYRTFLRIRDIVDNINVDSDAQEFIRKFPNYSADNYATGADNNDDEVDDNDDDNADDRERDTADNREDDNRGAYLPEVKQEGKRGVFRPSPSSARNVKAEEVVAERVLPPRPPSPPSKRSRRMAEPDDLPAWATTEFNVKNWHDVLIKYGVDETAIYELFLLSQMSADGARHANWIVSKLFKKKADGQELHNASAFVHSSVLKSRYQVYGRDL